MQKKYLYLNVFIFILSHSIIAMEKKENTKQFVESMEKFNNNNNYQQKNSEEMIVEQEETQLYLGLEDIFDDENVDLIQELSKDPLGQLFLSGFEQSFKNESSKKMIYMATLKNLLNNNKLGDKSLWSILKQFILKIYELKIFDNIDSINDYFNDVPAWALEFENYWLTNLSEHVDTSKTKEFNKKTVLERMLRREFENILNDLTQLDSSKYKPIFSTKIDEIFNGMNINITDFKKHIEKTIKEADSMSQKEMIKLKHFITDRLLRKLINTTDKIEENSLFLPKYFLLSDIYKEHPMLMRICILNMEDNVIYNYAFCKNYYGYEFSFFKFFENLQNNNLKLLICYNSYTLGWENTFVASKCSYEAHGTSPMQLILDFKKGIFDDHLQETFQYFCGFHNDANYVKGFYKKNEYFLKRYFNDENFNKNENFNKKNIKEGKDISFIPKKKIEEKWIGNYKNDMAERNLNNYHIELLNFLSADIKMQNVKFFLIPTIIKILFPNIDNLEEKKILTILKQIQDLILKQIQDLKDLYAQRKQETFILDMNNLINENQDVKITVLKIIICLYIRSNSYYPLILDVLSDKGLLFVNDKATMVLVPFYKNYDTIACFQGDPSFHQERLIIDQVFNIPLNLFNEITKYTQQYLTINNPLMNNYFSIKILCKLRQEKEKEKEKVYTTDHEKAIETYKNQLFKKISLWKQKMNINEIEYIVKTLLIDPNYSKDSIHNALISHLKKNTDMFINQKQEFYEILKKIIIDLRFYNLNDINRYQLFFFSTNEYIIDFNLRFLSIFLYVFLLFNLKDNIVKIVQKYEIILNNDLQNFIINDLQNFIINNNFTLLDFQNFTIGFQDHLSLHYYTFSRIYDNMNIYYKNNKKISMTDLSKYYDNDKIKILSHNDEILKNLYDEISDKKLNVLKTIQKDKIKGDFESLLIKELPSITKIITVEDKSKSIIEQFMATYPTLCCFYESEVLGIQPLMGFINENIFDLMTKKNYSESHRKWRAFEKYYEIIKMFKNEKNSYHNKIYSLWIYILNEGVVNNYGIQLLLDSEVKKIDDMIEKSTRQISSIVLNTLKINDRSINSFMRGTFKEIKFTKQANFTTYNKEFNQIEIFIDQILSIQNLITDVITTYTNTIIFRIRTLFKSQEEIINKFYKKLNKIIDQLKINDVEILLYRWDDVVQAL